MINTRHNQMLSTPIRAPTWVSARRLFEQKLENLHKCKELNPTKLFHAQILKQNLHKDLYVAPKLISSYSLCHQMKLAINVFNQIEYPNIHLYNTLMKAHVQNSQPSLAFAALSKMYKDGIFGDNYTYPILLKACDGSLWLPVVKMVHAQVEKLGLWGDLFVPNSLIDSYSKCGSLGVDLAMRLFVLMGDKDVITWNSMLGGLAKNGDFRRVRKLFYEMPVRDMISYNTMLDSYVKAGNMNEAFRLFENMSERNVVSWSIMVSGYCKAGDMDMGRMLFDRMPVKNLVPWTIIISGYAEKGLKKEAMKLYNQLELSGLQLDEGTFVSILAACAQSGLLGLGKKVHATIERTKFRYSTNMGNALIAMYSKCGDMEKALSFFISMPKKDLISWNCMLQGLAIHGLGEEALEFFSMMKKEGFKPDKVTMIGVLCACTHAGFVDQGIRYFNAMEREYNVIPEIEHYGCMIDLLGRGGRIKEAVRLIQGMPMEPNEVVWGTLLGACRVHNAVGLAEEALDQLVRLEPSDPGNYSILSNIFAAAGYWNDVAQVRMQMKSTGVEKPSGASSIEIDNEVHQFTVFDKSHPSCDHIYKVVNNLVQDLKYRIAVEVDGHIFSG